MGFVLFWPNQFGQFYKAPVSGPIQGQIIHSHQQPPLSAAGSQQLPSSAACHHSPAITPATFLATKKKKKKSISFVLNSILTLRLRNMLKYFILFYICCLGFIPYLYILQGFFASLSHFFFLSFIYFSNLFNKCIECHRSSSTNSSSPKLELQVEIGSGRHSNSNSSCDSMYREF
jgi:hypothetical protein